MSACFDPYYADICLFQSYYEWCWTYFMSEEIFLEKLLFGIHSQVCSFEMFWELLFLLIK